MAEIPKGMKRKHIITEIIRILFSPQIVCYTPKGFAQLLQG
ncbi:MAG: hypothetical protein JPMHGGIA_01602 [Saprospiraceae bacterium]|nr:hypothetical protein [Saprospiraceae bacterium]